MPHLLLCVNALINMNLSGFYTFWVVTFTSTLCTVCVWVFFFHKKSIKIQFSRGISFKKVTISQKILGVELPFSILCTEGGIMQIYRLLSCKNWRAFPLRKLCNFVLPAAIVLCQPLYTVSLWHSGPKNGVFSIFGLFLLNFCLIPVKRLSIFFFPKFQFCYQRLSRKVKNIFNA
jgi:hypothetical protein